MKMLETHELEQKIKSGISKVPEKKSASNLIFKKNLKNGEDGIYIFSDLQGYHYVLMERGMEVTHKVTDDVFKICFWCFFELTCNAAFNYELENRDENLNYRKVAFNKQLEYLNTIGESYRKCGEMEIDEILKKYPY